MDDIQQYLSPTAFIDSDNAAIQAFASNCAGDIADPREKAIALYYVVRDQIFYDPYNVALTPDGLKASQTLEQGAGWCVPKAILLAACCRAQGVPAKLGFADVKNHLSTERMRAVMGTDVFIWHGYTAIYLNGEWVKATPAFNLSLCEKFHIHPLEFDGLADSIYHEFDQSGNRHMEYLNYRGEFADMPLSELKTSFLETYGDLEAKLKTAASFEAEAQAEAEG